MEVGIVMDDVRYTNFDVTKYWKTQTWRYTDFDDVPELAVEQTDQIAAQILATTRMNPELGFTTG